MNDEFCRSLYLNCPSVVLCRSPPPPASWKVDHFWGQEPQVSSPKNCLSCSFQISDVILYWEHACDLLQLEERPICILYHPQLFLGRWEAGFTGPFTIWHHTEVWLRLDFPFYAPVHWQQYPQNTSCLLKKFFIPHCMTELKCLHLMFSPDVKTFGLVYCQRTVYGSLHKQNENYFYT